ncbi:MAG TPA: hypothetical protein VHV82_19030 [Sporichthyaceae bacterium]|nr:hypothetical protein [Sporichthyaceae bacterium]
MRQISAEAAMTVVVLCAVAFMGAAVTVTARHLPQTHRADRAVRTGPHGPLATRLSRLKRAGREFVGEP